MKARIDAAAAALACTFLSTTSHHGSVSASHNTAMLASSNRDIHRGDIRAGEAADALFRQARPYKQMQDGVGVMNDSSSTSSSSRRRRLDDFEIDGSYNIKFSQCVDIKLRNDDLFNDDATLAYTKAGQIISTKSYVLFHVCQKDDCYYESDDDLYMVDLPTYVRNLASYHATAKSTYCEACDTYYADYCASNRKLSATAATEQNQRRASSYITCDQCEGYGCGNTDDQQNNDEDEDDTVVELINDISECLNTGLNLNDSPMYVGFMCSPNGGNGVELAIFLDDQCTMYTNLKAFSDIPSYYIYNSADIFTKTETYIKKAFTETTSCLEDEFDDPANQSDGNDDNAAANNGGEVNEYCSGIFEAGAIAFSSCASNNDDQNNYGNNQNDDDKYSFYAYDMNYDGDEDLNEVCSVLQQMEGAYTYHYDSTNSGSWYSSSSSSSGSGSSGSSSSSQSSKGSWTFFSRGGSSSSEETSGGSNASSASTASATGADVVAIVLYVLLSFAVIIMTLFFIGWHARKKRREGRLREEPAYIGGRLV